MVLDELAAAAAAPPGSPGSVLDMQELLHNQSVSDVTWAAAQTMFGDQGVIDMTAHCGYYSLLAMVMNTTRRSVPESP